MKDILTYHSWDERKVNEINTKLHDSMDVLNWTFKEYGDEVVYACSFGAEGMVMLDLIYRVKRDAKVRFLDTELHFSETYRLIERAKKKYPEMDIECIKPSLSLQVQEEIYGERLWERSPDKCCHLRKVVPLAEQLEGRAAWISGLRTGQSPERDKLQFINKDEKFQSIKICPLIHWSWEDIWSYIKLHQLPYNELHDKNYPSIGCKVCTLPASNPEDLRSGRWANTNKKECGLHKVFSDAEKGGVTID
ncbi:phosphoadenylyl-sulfate reductase [Bacillus massilinigeriensis]|uniref:phosphoadenylyl-sulfate reductase n=1 Tax=Bacillus mediterraneensis TaxID=1805474 RepID=UPI000A8876B8|nr:phosphoadenylyl-sulfate reductase [Bacillus mediterraneensis]